MAVGQGAAQQVIAGPLHVLARQQRQLAPALPERLAVGIGHRAEAAAVERYVPSGMGEQALELRLLSVAQSIGRPPLGAFELEEQRKGGHAAARNGGRPGDVGKRAVERQDHGRRMQRIAAA